jgi:hypothetical protein
MQPTTAAWNALLAAFRAGVGTEALFAVVIPSRALALTSRLWPPGVLSPAYVLYPYLAPTGQGIGQLSLELADDRSSRRGNVSCQVATQAGQLGSVQGALLMQLFSIGEQPAQVLGAFVGGTDHDQVDLRTLFTGRITDLRLTRGTLSFTLVDGVDTDQRDIELPIGATVFPGSPLDAHGQSVPLIIGTALGLQPPLVGGPAGGTLATALPTVAVPTLDITETAANFPASGAVVIDAETVTYTGRRVGLLPDGTSTLQLLAPDRPTPVAHAAGTAVALAPPVAYHYLVGIGIGDLEVLAVRDQDGPVTAFTFATDFPGVPPGTGVLTLPAPHEGVSVDAQVIASPPPPTLVNGGFESGTLAPWTPLAGTVAVVIAQDALAGQYALQLQQLRTTATGVYQDVTVEVGERYTVLVYWRTPAQTRVIADDGDGEPEDNIVDNGDFTDPTDSAWEIDTGGMVDIDDEYRPGEIEPAPPLPPEIPPPTIPLQDTVYNGAQTFQLPVALFYEQGPTGFVAAGYRSFNCLMSQPITVTPGQPVLVDVRVRAWNQAAVGPPTSVGLAGAGGIAIQGVLPPCCEVQVHVTMGEYTHFLQPDQPRTGVGRMAEWRTVGAATRFTPSGSAYTFGVNIFGRYIGTVPPIELTSAVVVPAPATALAREATVTPLTAEDEAPLQASGLIELGTPTDPIAYTTRLVFGPTTWQALALSFVATEATARLSLLGQAAVAGATIEYDGVRFLPAGRNPVRVMAAVFAQFLPHLTLSSASVETAATRRDGWLFSGYVPEPGRTDALLTKMSQECFCTLYKDVAGVYQIVADDYDMDVALRLDSDRDVHQGSTGLVWGNPQEVYSDFYLWYQRVSTQVTTTQAGQYAAVLYVTPEDSISLNPDLQTLCAQAEASLGTRRRFDYYADFIADPVTADLLLTRLVQQLTLLAQALTVEASLAAVPLEVTDRVSVKTALVGPQPFVGEVRQTTLATSMQAPGLAVGLRVRQVGGARGVWESWDSWAVEGVLETPGGVRLPGTTGPPGTIRVREEWEEEEPEPPSGAWFFHSAFAPPATCCYGLMGVGPGQLDLAAGLAPFEAATGSTNAPALLFRNSNVASGVWDTGLTLAGGGMGSALGLYNGAVYVGVRPATGTHQGQLWRLDPTPTGPGSATMVTLLPSGAGIVTCMQETTVMGDGNWLYLATDSGEAYRWNGTTLETISVVDSGGGTSPFRGLCVLGDGVTHTRILLGVRDANGTSPGVRWLRLGGTPGSLTFTTVLTLTPFQGYSSNMISLGETALQATGSMYPGYIRVIELQRDATGAGFTPSMLYEWSTLDDQLPGALAYYNEQFYLGRVSVTDTPALELWRSTDGVTWEIAVDLATIPAADDSLDTNTGITALAEARGRLYAATSTLYDGPAPGLRVYCYPTAEGLV